MKRKALACLILIPILSGPFSPVSAGFMDKFKKSKSVNLAPFADQTIGLLGQLDYNLKRESAIRLRKYVDKKDPDMARLMQQASCPS